MAQSIDIGPVQSPGRHGTNGLARKPVTRIGPNRSVRTSVYVLVIGVLVIVLSSFLANIVERDFGRLDVQIVKFADPTGTVMDAKLYRPLVASPQNRLPGVLAIHGYQNDKDTQDAYALELGRRGFVVLAVDLLGHGSSGGSLSLTTPGFGADAGYQYLRSLPFVDASNLGVMGHSLGAMATLAVAQLEPDHKALNPQSGPDPSPGMRNVLLSQAQFDEFGLFRENQLTVVPLQNNPNRIAAFTGGSGPATWDTTFGSFADGTARREELINTVHPGVTHDSHSVAATTDWFHQALYQGRTDPYWFDPTQQTYMWKELVTLLSLLVAGFMLLPLANILLAAPFFRAVSQPIPGPYAARGRTWWALALLNALIAGVTYPLITQYGGLTDVVRLLLPVFAMPMANGVMLWFIGNALIFLGLFSVWYRGAHRRGVTLYDLGASFSKDRMHLDWRILGKTALLAGVLLGALYALEGIVELMFGQEFRFLWPFMRQFATGERVGLFAVYLIPALAFFLLNGGLFFFGEARPVENSGPTKSLFIWWAKTCFAALAGLAVVWLIQYVPFIWLNLGPGFELLGLPQFSQMWPLMLMVFIPEFAILLFLGTWFFRRTGRIYLGALMMASLAIWFTTAGSLIAG